MTLSEYLRHKMLSPAEFAREAGLSRSAVSRLLSGDRNPSWSTVRKVYDATDGLVRTEDWPGRAA